MDDQNQQQPAGQPVVPPVQPVEPVEPSVVPPVEPSVPEAEVPAVPPVQPEQPVVSEPQPVQETPGVNPEPVVPGSNPGWTPPQGGDNNGGVQAA